MEEDPKKLDWRLLSDVFIEIIKKSCSRRCRKFVLTIRLKQWWMSKDTILLFKRKKKP